MKITIELDDEKCTVESNSGVLLDDALQLVKQALLGIGFIFDGDIELINDEEK